MKHIYIYVLCVGKSKALPVLYPSYSTVYVGGARNTARHVKTVIILAFLTQEYKAGKTQSIINQLTLYMRVLLIVRFT